MSRPILITGATGFAGGHLLDRLSQSDVEIVAWSRSGQTPDTGAQARTRWEAVDLLDAAAVREGIGRLTPAAVYHCAGAAHVGYSWNHTASTFASNVRGTHHLLEALRLARSDARVLVPSSAMIYRPAEEPLTEDHPLAPQSPYGLSKLAQELLACRFVGDGLGVTIARAFNHVGPRQDSSFVASSFARQIVEIEAGRRNPELVVGNLDARRDLTDVRDTVRAYTRILERGQPGRPYNVCSGRAIAIRDLLEMLVARARVRVDIRVDPERYRPNDLPLLLGDPSRVRDELGWSPEIPLEQTLDDLLDHWRKLELNREHACES